DLLIETGAAQGLFLAEGRPGGGRTRAARALSIDCRGGRPRRHGRSRWYGCGGCGWRGGCGRRQDHGRCAGIGRRRRRSNDHGRRRRLVLVTLGILFLGLTGGQAALLGETWRHAFLFLSGGTVIVIGGLEPRCRRQDNCDERACEGEFFFSHG